VDGSSAHTPRLLSATVFLTKMLLDPDTRPSPGQSTARAGLALVVIATLLSGCSDLATGSPLSNAYRTPEALAEAALEAIAGEDAEALQALLITRDEYESLVWPILPDSRGSTTFEFVWSISNPRNRKARREVLDDFGGIPLEVVSVDLGDEIEAYDEFVLYKEAILTVRRTDTGQEGRMGFLDVLIEMNGGWKFMNFQEG
jgi:hypothetical protein